MRVRSLEILNQIHLSKIGCYADHFQTVKIAPPPILYIEKIVTVSIQIISNQWMEKNHRDR